MDSIFGDSFFNENKASTGMSFMPTPEGMGNTTDDYYSLFAKDTAPLKGSLIPSAQDHMAMLMNQGNE